ncbi:MAG: hypothetical protein K6E58_04915 [Eubacterium sp.]|nr:hypothetical protein [Eubacterium sp.]
MKALKLLLLICLVTAAVSFTAVYAAEQPATSTKTTQKPAKKIKTKVSKKEMKKFFNKSAFIGSSIGLGQRIYMKQEGKKYMGHPKMLVKGCYAFTSDKGGKYSISYKGKSGPARYVVKRSKVKRVFINMGTNDLFEGHKKVFQRYKKYIASMKKVNKGIVIYIESMPPVYKSGQKKGLNNKNVNKLNKNLEKYCKKKKDVYYIDITTSLKDKSGGLAKKYTSDKYVHITMAGYRVWHKKVYKYVKKQLKTEKKAKKAVKYARKYRTSNEINRSNRLVNKLEKSTIKSNLKKKLRKVKVKA